MPKKEQQFNFMNFGFIITTFMTATVSVATLFFILGISMNPMVAPIGFILAGGFYWLLDHSHYHEKVIMLLICLGVIALSILIMSNIFDFSWDGNSYRKLMTGTMTEGWNPVYQIFHTVQDNYVILNGSYPVSVTENMPKSTWIFASAIHSLTGNIEAGKCFNVLSIIACFSVYLSVCKDYFHFSRVRSLLISLLIVASPITLAQALSYYADAFLANLFFSVMALLILFTLKKDTMHEKILWLLIFMSVVLGINSKINSLIMLGVPCIAFVVYWIIRFFKDDSKDTKEKTVHSIKLIGFFSVMVVIATCFLGTTSYLQNLVYTGNPIYPTNATGDTPLDQLPAVIIDKSNSQRFFYSLFSETNNTLGNNGEQPHLKIPFTFQANEFELNPIDIRSGGWGIFFSGVFVVSLIILTVYCIYAFRKKQISLAVTILLVSGSVLLPPMIFPGMWWARYNMAIIIMPVMSIAFLLSSDFSFLKSNRSIVSKILSCVLALFLFISCIPAITRNIKVISSSQIVKSELFSLRQQVGQDEVVGMWFIHTFDGLQFNLKDLGIRYKRLPVKPEKGTPIYTGYMVWSK